MGQISINGKICEFNEGEYILNIARRNHIFIPAICYLSGCSPTLACRLCMAEADGKRVYTCNTKAKDGMQVLTDTQDIKLERKAIMQTYCINHPLECGVCDQSGECELQNFVHHMGVDIQEYAIKDTYKPHKKWNLINYDPSLCIVCERCVSVCKDKIGEAALKTVPRQANMPAKELKDIMPKDAYAVWSKFQKSLIAPSNSDTLQCSMCGECSAVCPVGALVIAKFQYTSNAWELTKIPASNPHSSDCELIYYDVKRTCIEDRRNKIYRISSDYNFAELNPAARFGFDFNKPQSSKNRVIFERIVSKIKNGEIKTIKFNSFITNEEAKILSLLKEKFCLNLINPEAKAYQNFMKEFSKYCGNNLYNGDFDSVKNADFIISAGGFLRSDSPNLSYKLNNALKINKAGGVYFHPLRDKVVENYSKNFISCNHDAFLDIEILLFILEKFGSNLPFWVEKKLSLNLQNSEQHENRNSGQSKTVFSNYAEIIGLDEEKFNEISKNKENPVLIIGEDYIFSENNLALARLAGMIQRFTKFKVLIIPPRTNSLGVSMICELDEEIKGEVLGYNEKGDITFSCFKADLDAPALNEQEGTFTNLDRRVVPTNAALKYEGFELLDIARELGIDAENAIDFTPDLGKDFKNIKFDDLENFYDNAGGNHRGYKLEIRSLQAIDDEFEFKNRNKKIKNIMIYKANPVHQFSKFSNAASQLNEIGRLYAGSEFLKANSFNDNDILIIKKNEKSLVVSVKLDNNTDGAYLPFFDEKLNLDDFFESRFGSFAIERMLNE